jgi:hypothetical protein
MNHQLPQKIEIELTGFKYKKYNDPKSCKSVEVSFRVNDEEPEVYEFDVNLDNLTIDTSEMFEIINKECRKVVETIFEYEAVYEYFQSFIVSGSTDR